METEITENGTVYPYVSFLEIGGNKTLLLTYQDKETAEFEL
ncbi:hypothetical protein [Mucilaginibacter pedocola]|nr:hypothetical protein [Mucilaginibacter pedocola]